MYSIWKEDIAKKPLNFVNSEILRIGIPQPVCNSVRCNNQDCRRAQIKMKILTGIYVLQENRSNNFNQYKVNPTCKFCDRAPEDRGHFVARCESLREVCIRYSRQVKDLLGKYGEQCILDQGIFIQLVLDCTMPTLRHLHISHAIVPEIELWSTDYVNRLHFTRLKLLKDKDSRVAEAEI